MYRITLREGREKLPMKHHPWVFSGAIRRIEPKAVEAGWADVFTSDGRFIAHGWYDEKSHIVLHLISWKEDEIMDDECIAKLVTESVRRRGIISEGNTTAYRLIHGEADFLPGIAADIYGKEIRIVISSRFADHFLPVIAEALDNELKPDIIEASVDKAYAGSEGLKERTRTFIRGKETDDDFSGRSAQEFLEDGIRYSIEPGKGQKSGFYCDQRVNRKIVERYAAGKRVLDLFSFTGGFTLHALRGGCASVDSVDSSFPAVKALEENIRRNEDDGILPVGSAERSHQYVSDCFDFLRSSENGRYDMMILDPPKLAKTKSALENAIRAYKDLNRVAMLKIENGGIIATFSCSGAVTREDFRMMLSWAAADAGVEIQLIETLSAGPDHPVRLSFPESEYLKGCIIRVLKG